MAGKGMQRGSKSASAAVKMTGSMTSKTPGSSHKAQQAVHYGAGGEGGRAKPSFKDTKPKMFCADGKHGC